jgi:tetratricopeptide (TPR) repeat protein
MRGRWRHSSLWWLVLPAVGAATGSADTITLTNGRVIQADRAWYEGTQLLYERAGAVFGLPRGLVRSVEATPSAVETAPDPDVARANELAEAGRDKEARELLSASLRREPRNAPALVALARLSLRAHDARAAADAAEKAARVDPRDPAARTLLGDALLTLGQRTRAADAYKASLALRADPVVKKKLEEIQPQPAGAAGGAQFRLRYDGGINEPLGVAVLQVLTSAFSEYEHRLGFTPPEPVTVVLQTETDFLEGGAPGWAEGVYDGTVRIPVKGIDQPTQRLQVLLRHELAHSFVTSRTGGNCPTWLQEGVAQWLEGGAAGRSDGSLQARARSGGLLPLLTLEAPFQNLPPADVGVAYAESLSGIAHLLRLRGEEGVVRLLAALGDGTPSEEALPVAVGLSYPEFEKSWEQYLAANGAARTR